MPGRFTPNDVFKHQQKQLIPATFKKAYISSINASARTVNVYFIENRNNVIRNVPLATHISTASLAIGQRCRVDIFDETGANNMVVAYCF